MKLRKEYADIVERERNAMGAVIGGNTHNAFINLAAACQALADRPMKELTDAELRRAYDIEYSKSGNHASSLLAVIAADRAKQREPEVVKFRAARHKDTGIVFMSLADQNPLSGSAWEWLEPAQEFEVKV